MILVLFNGSKELFKIRGISFAGILTPLMFSLVKTLKATLMKWRGSGGRLIGRRFRWRNPDPVSKHPSSCTQYFAGISEVLSGADVALVACLCVSIFYNYFRDAGELTGEFLTCHTACENPIPSVLQFCNSGDKRWP